MKQINSICCLFLLALGQYSCKNPQIEYAAQWTNDIKARIVAGANQQADKKIIDSTRNTLTLYKGDRKLKQFEWRARFDTATLKIISIDTIISIFYSADQRFELVRELCPGVERSFEGVKYEGIGAVGLAEFRFCDGKIKERGFRIGYKEVGVWTKYDSTGKIVEEKDNGNEEELEKLRDIKYDIIPQSKKVANPKFHSN